VATSNVARLALRPPARSHFSQQRRELGHPDLRYAIETLWRRSMSAGHLRNRARIQPFEKLARCYTVVLLVRRKDDQKKSVFRSKDETRHVEHRMIRHGQSVQRQHA